MPRWWRRRCANCLRHAELCWLNDCHYDARGGFRFRLRRKLARYAGLLPAPSRVSFTRMPDMMVATDAYVVTPDFARRAREAIYGNLGAIDRHMQLFVARHRCLAFQTYPALFTTDFTDSDTSPRNRSATPNTEQVLGGAAEKT